MASMDVLLKGRDYSASPVETELRSVLGGLLAADWRHAMIARGFGWNFPVGSFSTPITGGGAGTVVDADQPEFVIDVPTGTCMVPLRIFIQCQTPLIVTDADEGEIVLQVDRVAVSGATSTQGTVETPLNMRSDKTTGCPCSVVSAISVNTTAAPTVSMELGRSVVVGDVQGTAANALWGKLELLYEPRNPLFIVGPGSLWGYWGGTVATSGFAQVEFLAFPSALVTGLV